MPRRTDTGSRRWPWSATGWPSTWSTSPTTSTPSIRAASGPWCCPTRAAPSAPGSPPCARPAAGGGGPGGARPPTQWISLARPAGFEAGVDAIRAAIAAGDVYQVNLTRRLRRPGPARGRRGRPGGGPGRRQPGAVPRRGAPARPGRGRWPRPRPSASWPSPGPRIVPSGPLVAHQGHGAHRRRLPGQGPGRERDDRRPGPQRPGSGVRVGLGAGPRPARPSSATRAWPTWSARWRARLRPGLGWAATIEATFPPGSVTGAPKLAALDHIARLEPVDRGIYCGAVGWVDADAGRGRAERGHPHLLARRGLSSTSAPVAPSPGTRPRPASGTRPS